jgi:hypothetical protein
MAQRKARFDNLLEQSRSLTTHIGDTLPQLHMGFAQLEQSLHAGNQQDDQMTKREEMRSKRLAKFGK